MCAHHFDYLGFLSCSLFLGENVLSEHDSAEQRAHCGARHRADFNHRVSVHVRSPVKNESCRADTTFTGCVGTAHNHPTLYSFLCYVVCIMSTVRTVCMHRIPGWCTTVVQMWSMQQEKTIAVYIPQCNALEWTLLPPEGALSFFLFCLQDCNLLLHAYYSRLVRYQWYLTYQIDIHPIINMKWLNENNFILAS